MPLYSPLREGPGREALRAEWGAVGGVRLQCPAGPLNWIHGPKGHRRASLQGLISELTTLNKATGWAGACHEALNAGVWWLHVRGYISTNKFTVIRFKRTTRPLPDEERYSAQLTAVIFCQRKWVAVASFSLNPRAISAQALTTVLIKPLSTTRGLDRWMHSSRKS